MAISLPNPRPALDQTPFHAHLAARFPQALWDRWNGFLAADQCGDLQEEVHAIFHAAALIDVSPLYAIHVQGADASAVIDRVSTISVSKIGPDQVRPALLCRDDGAVMAIADVICWGPNDFSMITETSIQPWVEEATMGFNATVTDLMRERVALGLFGAGTTAVLDKCGLLRHGEAPLGTTWSAARQGVGVRIIRHAGTGGPFGLPERTELWIDPGDAASLWSMLERHVGESLLPVGLKALEAARITLGWPRLGIDGAPAAEASHPQEALDPVDLGLERWIEWDRRAFSGRRALEARRKGPTGRLYHVDLPEPVEKGHSLLRDGSEIARLTSVAASPVTGLWSGIALAPQPVPRNGGRWCLAGSGEPVTVRGAGLGPAAKAP